MTAELLGAEAPDVEDFVVCWLAPLLRSAVDRETDELPFALVVQITGEDDPDCGESEDGIQIDILGLGVQAAKLSARQVHRRMMLLALDLEPVTMSDNSLACADYVFTTLKPIRMPYADDQIVRYVARYRVGSSYAPVT